MKDWQLHLQNVTSISIHKLGSYRCYKRCHRTYVQVAKMKPAYQNQKRHENLVLTPWVTSKVTSYQATC
jgi:hypothetical protein